MKSAFFKQDYLCFSISLNGIVFRQMLNIVLFTDALPIPPAEKRVTAVTFKTRTNDKIECRDLFFYSHFTSRAHLVY